MSVRVGNPPELAKARALPLHAPLRADVPVPSAEPAPPLLGAPVPRPEQGHPAVAFVDDGALTPFVQLAVALRRAGYRTVRVTTARRSIGSAFTRRFAFDRLCHVDASEIEALDLLLADEALVDVHCVEGLAPSAYRALDRLPGAPRAGWRNRGDLVDKANMVRLLRSAGIAHPDTLPGTADPAEAARTLGLPVVVKPRVGAFGRGVFMARSVEELEHQLASVPRQDTQLEAYVEGVPVNYCAVVGAGAERDMTYRTLRRGGGPCSPSSAIECYRDDALSEIGRRLAAVLPCEGFVNVDAIKDARGRYFVHDVNLRVWGALFAAWSAGYDLTGAYLRWLSDQVRRGVGDRSRVAFVFPDSATAAILANRRRPDLRTVCRQLRAYRQLLGLGYAVRELAGLVRGFVLGPRAPRSQARGASTSPPPPERSGALGTGPA